MWWSYEVVKIVFGSIIAIVFVGFLLIGDNLKMGAKSNMTTLRVAFPTKMLVTQYEPTNISLDYEYIFLENIFSPLVEIDRDGVIVFGVAENVEWLGDELKLTIRKNLTTKSGKKITTEDVLFSLKRLLVLSGNTHGNFKDIVCPNTTLKSVEESCDGLRSDGSAVYIKARGGKAFLVPMLSAIDFAVIPKTSVDPQSLKITDYSETSGVYYLDHQDSDGKIYLKANQSHYFYSDKIAQEIVLVPSDVMTNGDSLRLLKEGKVDHITTVDQSRADEVLQFASDNAGEFETHSTMKIRTTYAQFTSRGEKELTPEERRYIAENLRQVFADIYKDIKGFESRSEFFPSLSEGSLDKEQKEILAKENAKIAKGLNKKIKIGLLKKSKIESWIDPIVKALPMAECYRETNLPEFKKYDSAEDMPHVYIGSADTGFLEDISLISYSLNAGILGLTKSEREKWLADYMSSEDKDYRMNKLRNLHYKALVEPVLVPLLASPYTALTRKGWKIELSELYANNQLWRIKRN